METETGIETKEEVIETIEPQVTEPTPPSAETLQRELAELRQKYEQTEKGLRSAQETLTRKDRLLKEKDANAQRFDSIEESIQILAGAIAKGNLDNEEMAGAKKEFAALKQKRQQAEQERIVAEQKEEFIQKASSIYKEAEEVFGDDPDTLHNIRNLIRANDFDLAEKKIEKAKRSASVEKKPDENKELLELRKTVEKLQKQLSGELESETGLPAGAGATEAQIRANYRSNPYDPKAMSDYNRLMASK